MNQSRTENPQFIYKVLTAEAWAAGQTQGNVPEMPIDRADGYMHLSTAVQLAETLRLHFAGQSGLVIAAIRLADVAHMLRWEPSRGGQLFPHAYGLVPKAAMAWIETLDVGANGNFTLPDRVR